MRRALLFTTALVISSPAYAADDLQTLKAQLKTLEGRINQLEAEKNAAPVQQTAAAPPSNPNSFNPAIGVILNGTIGAFSQGDNIISGFAVGDEGQRPDKGISLGESEVSFYANIDDMFTGGLVASLNNQNEVGVEEAFIQTLGLPYGLNVKAGRMLANLGYMNEKHAHTDDFADRPLPYRVFLNGAFNDDGLQMSWIAPTDFYTELGGGVWRGGDFPAADAHGTHPGAYSAYARVGGDIGDNQNWRLGLSYLHSDADGTGRETGDQTFKGNDNLYIADAKYNWSPTGNSQNQELSLQGEYFLRHENGTYADSAVAIAATPYDKNQTGWYGQAVYKFAPEWRIGYRYTGLDAADAPIALAGSALDDKGHSPYINSVMGDWTHSEFSRIRLQYNNDHSGPETDNQFLMQYIVSLGAHGAHKY